jgi:hypothetical protein
MCIRYVVTRAAATALSRNESQGRVHFFAYGRCLSLSLASRTRTGGPFTAVAVRSGSAGG